jgi:hypothetical protein
VEVVELTVNIAVAMGSTYALVRFDRSRIPAAWRKRGWNEATTGAAIYAFAPFCIIAYYWVTRRSARGIATGFAALALLLATQFACSSLVTFFMGR